MTILQKNVDFYNPKTVTTKGETDKTFILKGETDKPFSCKGVRGSCKGIKITSSHYTMITVLDQKKTPANAGIPGRYRGYRFPMKLLRFDRPPRQQLGEYWKSCYHNNEGRADKPLLTSIKMMVITFSCVWVYTTLWWNRIILSSRLLAG